MIRVDRADLNRVFLKAGFKHTLKMQLAKPNIHWNINDLWAFLETARLGSLSAAGRHLDRTPAAVSTGLRRLESSLGVRLMERNSRSCRLTPEGTLFRDRVVSALDLLDEAARLAQAERKELAGEIRVTAPADFARQYLRRTLDDFQQRHPGVRIRLRVTDELQDLLSEPLDFAIRYGELPDSNLVATPLAKNQRIPVASPGYIDRFGMPKDPQELLEHNCLVYARRGEAYTQWRFQRGKDISAVSVRGDRQASDGSIVREWALEGAGIAYKSELDVFNEIESGRLVRVLPDWRGETAPLNVLYPGRGPRPARVKRLVDFLKEQLRDLRPG